VAQRRLDLGGDPVHDSDDLKMILYYLRHVNEANDGDNVFVRCVYVCLSVCLCMCVCAQRTGQSDQLTRSSATA